MAKTPEERKSQQSSTGQTEQARSGETSPVPYRRGGGLAPMGFEPFHRIRSEFDRLFDRLLPTWFGPEESLNRNNHWALDVEEEEGKVVVRAEAPGFEPSDFDIQVRGDQLLLRAAHRSESHEKERGFHEWHRQELYRSITLGGGIDADKVEADYHNGILTVTLPKTEQARGRRIQVKG
jgi:HSP20 family protein